MKCSFVGCLRTNIILLIYPPLTGGIHYIWGFVSIQFYFQKYSWQLSFASILKRGINYLSSIGLSVCIWFKIIVNMTIWKKNMIVIYYLHKPVFLYYNRHFCRCAFWKWLRQFLFLIVCELVVRKHYVHWISMWNIPPTVRSAE